MGIDQALSPESGQARIRAGWLLRLNLKFSSIIARVEEGRQNFFAAFFDEIEQELGE